VALAAEPLTGLQLGLQAGSVGIAMTSTRANFAAG